MGKREYTVQVSKLFAWVLVLLVLLCSRPESVYSQEFSSGGEAGPAERVRSLFRAAGEPAAGERIVVEISSDAAAFLRAEVTAADGEASLLEQLRSLEKASLSPAVREHILERGVTRLGAVGTRVALPLLHRLSAEEPSVVLMVPGCRSKIAVAVFDYRRASDRAAVRVEKRAFHSEFQALDERGRLAWLVASAGVGRESPRLAVALERVRGIDDERRDELRRRLTSGTGVLSPSAGELLVEIDLVDEHVCDLAVFRRLPLAAAQRFILQSAESDTESFRDAALELGRRQAGVASLAGFLDAENGTLDPRDYLERDGATAAAVLSRDGSVGMTSQLLAVLRDGDATETLKRHAALALMHQGTPAARGALLETVLAGAVVGRLAVKLETWLER